MNRFLKRNNQKTTKKRSIKRKRLGRSNLTTKVKPSLLLNSVKECWILPFQTILIMIRKVGKIVAKITGRRNRNNPPKSQNHHPKIYLKRWI